MRIQAMRTVVYFVGSAILLFAIIATVVNNEWEEQDPLLAYLEESGMINHEMAELLRTDCMLEFMRTKKTLQYQGIDFVEQRSTHSSKLESSSGRTMHNVADALQAQVNQMLIGCVRKDRVLHIGGNNKDSDTRYPSFWGILFKQFQFSTRRALAQTSGEAPAPSPTVSSPSRAPAPSPAVLLHNPAPAPSPTLSSPSSAPAVFPLPSKIPASSPLLQSYPPDLNNANLQPTGDEHSSDVNSSKQNVSRSTVIIAVAATASVTLFISALLFLFWLCCFGTGSGQSRSDDQPLIWLSSSGYSTASPHKSFGFGTVENEQMLWNQSFDDNLNHNKVGGNSYKKSNSLGNSIPVGMVAGAATNPVETSLQMLSEMSGAPGLPPVEPLAGRINLPTRPPGDATPPPPPHPPTKPSSRASHPPPPPPPPPPIPPTKPSSGAASPPPPPIPPTKPSSGAPRPPPRPMPPGVENGPHQPPPSSASAPPRPPAIGLKHPRPAPPPGPRHPSISTSVEKSEAATKAKLKPFFWDKVLANPDHSMVWDHIRSGSFHFNEEMIENLFGYEPAGRKSSSQEVAPQQIHLINPKKSQNLSIMLRALNVTTEDVCVAIEEGNELPPELIQTLLKMAPTTEEEIKLQKYSGELSQLDPAEQFLKVLIDIPFAYERLESLLFMCTLHEDVSMLGESFAVLEAACTELRGSRLFLKLLEAVLKTGNRMNDGTFRGGAQAFKLDTLLKLSDVKGTDGKTTLLHFVVQEIILSEGRKAARLAQETGTICSSDDLSEDSIKDSDECLRCIGLHVVSGLGIELENVKKAAALDADSLTATVAKLRNELAKARDFLNSVKNVAKENGFCQVLMSFVQNAEIDITSSAEEEKRILSLVKNTGDYFHGNTRKDEGLRLFKIVGDFLTMLDKECREVRASSEKPRTSRKKDTKSNLPRSGRNDCF